MSFSIAARLTPTPSDREGVADAVSRCVCGIDTADEALFRSAFTDDAVFDLNSEPIRGIDAIVAQCYDIVSKLDTTHMTSNLRATFAADGRSATATATGVAHHYPPARGLSLEDGGAAHRLVVGSLYNIELVKVEGGEHEGMWKAKTWKLKSVWTQGDWAVMGSLPGDRGGEKA